MKKRIGGFTLVEMLIVIAIFGFVLAGTSQMFLTTFKTHRQQSRIAESNIEGVIGLELLRQDIGKAGFGLPWHGTFNYTEAASNPYSLNQSTTAPLGIVTKNNAPAWNGIIAGSDYLVVRASNIATNKAAAKWTFLLESGQTPTWTSSTSDNFDNTDRVIILSPGSTDANSRTLVTPGTQFSSSTPGNSATDYVAPPSGPETRLVYGIDSSSDLRMPFNRADYFVKVPSSSEMPRRCAQGTGVLYKAVVNQGVGPSGGGFDYMPLLDCVADMQVIFRNYVANGSSTSISWFEDVSGSDALTIRSQINEARVFILAHEGQQDPSFSYPSNTIHVGDSGYGRDFDLSGIPNWRNFRWKVYTLVVKLDNLL